MALHFQTPLAVSFTPVRAPCPGAGFKFHVADRDRYHQHVFPVHNHSIHACHESDFLVPFSKHVKAQQHLGAVRPDLSMSFPVAAPWPPQAGLRFVDTNGYTV